MLSVGRGEVSVYAPSVLTQSTGVGSHLEQIALRCRVHQEGDGGAGEEQRLVQDTQESERLSLRPVSGQSVAFPSLFLWSRELTFCLTGFY